MQEIYDVTHWPLQIAQSSHLLIIPRAKHPCVEWLTHRPLNEIVNFNRDQTRFLWMHMFELWMKYQQLGFHNV